MKIENWYTDEAGEKPLEHPVSDGGFCGIFRNFSVIGDSLSSGEFEAKDSERRNTYYDMFEYSWGQYLARMAGSVCFNLSKGGMTAKGFLESFGEQINYRESVQKSEAVYIALGVNDVSAVLSGNYEFGMEEDTSAEEAFAQGRPTFAGYYSQLVRNVIEANPFAHVFLITVPDEQYDPKRQHYYDLHREMVFKLCQTYPRCYAVDLRGEGPKYGKEFHDRFYMSGHLNPAGYLLTAKLVATYTDYIIRHNMNRFCQIGFTHNDVKNPDYFK